ncbi:Sm protein [Tritrichomonas foetus]|uniref:Sm protein n=1 Tax=Tritrichomonas foetus TaxID=1144522 RepID=A0A1J4JYC1_9EUKA|nr:Sm protein [Tritrichomonas foetus]|eukprot:OHT02524.1 Sm protein [Tritrichomonas foetus]
MSAAEKPMPQDFLRLCLERRVKVQILEGGRELVGVLQAYDEHCNIVLNEVNETSYMYDEKGTPLRTTRQMDLLFIRGERIVTISPVDESA